MKKRNPKPFYVINYDINGKKMEPYDVMPYLIGCYDEAKKKKKAPTTVEEFKQFVKDKSLYQWWSRCEYEIILVDWPCSSTKEKWDVYRQVMMNIDTVVDILMENLGVH